MATPPSLHPSRMPGVRLRVHISISGETSDVYLANGIVAHSLVMISAVSKRAVNNRKKATFY